MHKLCFVLFLFCFSAWSQVQVRNSIAQLPRSFEAATPVKYLSHGPAYSVCLTATEVRMASPGRMFRMKLKGASRHARIEPLDPLPGKSSYFIGSDPSKWQTNIENYAKVALRNVYPGVDLIFYGNQEQLEYDVVVTPGADPNQVRLKLRASIACEKMRMGT